MRTEDFIVESGGERVRCILAIPDPARQSAESGLLLNISATAHYALHHPGQNHPTKPFLDAGHYVLSFDLPHHGERVSKYGPSLGGMGKALLAGDDPFEQFVSDAKAAMDYCLTRGIGTSGKIVSYGVSRAGYLLLRLAAADPRLRAVGAPSPVTDWAYPTEFTDACPKDRTGPILIDNWVRELSQAAVYLSVGSQDDIVGTKACVRFAMKLFDVQRKALPKDRLISQLHVVDSKGHSPSQESRLDATRFLLRQCDG